MWTAKNRGRYDRSALRYPSDLTDDEWALVEPLIPPAKRGGNRRHVDVREVMNGIMYILSTGCQWRAIPKDLPPRSTVHDYLDLWSYDGTLDRVTRKKHGQPATHQIRGDELLALRKLQQEQGNQNRHSCSHRNVVVPRLAGTASTGW